MGELCWHEDSALRGKARTCPEVQAGLRSWVGLSLTYSETVTKVLGEEPQWQL